MYYIGDLVSFKLSFFDIMASSVCSGGFVPVPFDRYNGTIGAIFSGK